MNQVTDMVTLLLHEIHDFLMDVAATFKTSTGVCCLTAIKKFLTVEVVCLQQEDIKYNRSNMFNDSISRLEVAINLNYVKSV